MLCWIASKLIIKLCWAARQVATSASCAEALEAEGRRHGHRSLARSPTRCFSVGPSPGHWQWLCPWSLPPHSHVLLGSSQVENDGLDAGFATASLALEKQLRQTGAAGALLER